MSMDREAFLMRDIKSMAQDPIAPDIAPREAQRILVDLMNQIEFYQVSLGEERWSPPEQSIYTMSMGDVVTLIEQCIERLTSLKERQKQRSILTYDMQDRIRAALARLNGK